MKKERGFTLIEVLIALLVLAVGLLGMASLMMTSLQSSQSAYLHSQASLLAQDLVERMRANRDHAVKNDSYELAASAAATTNPGCATSSSGCSPSAQARQDLHDWRAALETGIPGATATIERSDDPDEGNHYTITIAWEENASEDADNDPDTPRTRVPATFELRVNL